MVRFAFTKPGSTRFESRRHTGAAATSWTYGSWLVEEPTRRCRMASMHSVHAQRRQHVLEAIGASGVMVLPAAPLLIRNNDVEHEYRQDSDVFYLTGFDEPESVVVLGGTGERRFTLFVRPRDPEREVWDGARAGVDG